MDRALLKANLSHLGKPGRAMTASRVPKSSQLVTDVRGVGN